MKLRSLQTLFALLLLAAPNLVSAQMYQYNVGTLANVFPFQTVASNRVQWLYTPAHFPTAPAGNITSIYVKVATGNTNITYYNFKISLGTTAQTSLGTNGLTYPWNTALTTVLYAPISYSVPVALTGGWVQFPLTTPWFYNATSNFILEISDTAYVNGFSIVQDYNVNGARLYGNYAAAVGTANTGLMAMGFDLASGCVGTPNVPTITTPPINPPICIGSTTSISAAAIGGQGITYQWQQSTTATGPWFNVTGGSGANTLTYTTPPMSATTWYQLVVTCTNSSQSSYSAAFQVPVANPLITNGIPASRCGPGTVTLGAAGSGNTSFNWYAAPSGGSPIGTGPTFTTPVISTTTTYYVSATAGNCEGGTRTAVTATVNPLPVIGSFASTNPTICFGSNGTITINGLTPSTAYTLTYRKNGNPIGPLNINTNATGQYVITGLTIGTYTQVSVTLASTGCQSDTLAPITLVQPIIVPTPTVNNNGPICAGATINLTANTTPGSTYTWNGPGGFSSTTQNPTIGAAQTLNAGTYTVIANFQGCISNPGTTTVVVHPLPPANITAAGTTNICAGSTVQLNANTGGGLSYSWRLNTAPIPGANANAYAAGAAGSYTVRVTSNFGCNSTSNAITVAVKPLPVPVVSHNTPLSFCEGNSVLLVGSTDPNSPTYQWYKNTAIINGATSTGYTVFQSGTYTYRITNDFGCTGLSAGTDVVVFPILNPIISRNDKVLSTTPFVSYQWYYNNVAIPGATGPSITMTGNGFYEVETTDANGCKSKSAMAWIQNLGVGNTGVNGADIKLYPNPASDVIHIDAPIAVNMTIRNVHGQMILSQDNATVVNIAALANGVYSVVLTDKNGQLIKTEKLVKMNR